MCVTKICYILRLSRIPSIFILIANFVCFQREVLQRDVDRERRLRLDSECRLRNSVSETERYRARLAAIQREFTRQFTQYYCIVYLRE